MSFSYLLDFFLRSFFDPLHHRLQTAGKKFYYKMLKKWAEGVNESYFEKVTQMRSLVHLYRDVDLVKNN